MSFTIPEPPVALILSVPKPTTLSRLSRPELEMPGFSARVLLLRCPMHLEALNKLKATFSSHYLSKRCPRNLRKSGFLLTVTPIGLAAWIRLCKSELAVFR